MADGESSILKTGISEKIKREKCNMSTFTLYNMHLYLKPCNVGFLTVAAEITVIDRTVGEMQL